MIKVPSTWECTSYPCALVSIEEELYTLCRVIPVRAPCVSYEFDCGIRCSLSSSLINHSLHSDFTKEEQHIVRIFSERNDSFTKKKYRYIICDDDDDDDNNDDDDNDDVKTQMENSTHSLCSNSTAEENENDSEKYKSVVTLRIYCPYYVQKAESVVLCGPRIHARNTVAALSSMLSGNYVMKGCTFEVDANMYTVHSVQVANRSTCTGVTFVTATSRIKLNDTDQNKSSIENQTIETVKTELIGLQAKKRTLLQLVKFALTHDRSSVGVIVRGPRGCGVHTLVYSTLDDLIRPDNKTKREGNCDQDGSKENDSDSFCWTDKVVSVRNWTPSFNVIEERGNTSRYGLYRSTDATKLEVLIIDNAELHFPQENYAFALNALRKLTLDIDCLCCSSSVFIIALTHQYASTCATTLMESIFTFHLTLTLPDAEMRAMLLAHCRSGNAERWESTANTLVGKTSQEVLEIGLDRSWVYSGPFKTVKWDEIGGYDEVKRQLQRSLIWPLREPEAFARFNLTPPKGILLYGPPGCAKTTLVKALCSDGFFSFIYLDSATVVSAYVGESERYLRDVFARAATQAPCIVFFDEVEVLGGKRSGNVQNKAHGSSNSSEQVRLLSTLLTEMDGFGERKGVCFVGATNVPHLIDSALLRPGRFDHLIYVPLPTFADRRAILSILLEHVRTDLDTLAAHTEDFTGADLKALCSGALIELLVECNVHQICSTANTTTKSTTTHLACQTLDDANEVTTFLLHKITQFKRLAYNFAEMKSFHDEHTSDERKGVVPQRLFKQC